MSTGVYRRRFDFRSRRNKLLEDGPPPAQSIKINGITSVAKINGVALANIAKVNGVSTT